MKTQIDNFAKVVLSIRSADLSFIEQSHRSYLSNIEAQCVRLKTNFGNYYEEWKKYLSTETMILGPYITELNAKIEVVKKEGEDAVAQKAYDDAKDKMN